MPSYSEGDIVSEKPMKIGNSYYILLSKDILDYFQDYDPEKDLLVVKFEKGKWGRYIGIGKKKIK
jgi:hypothetical protein